MLDTILKLTTLIGGIIALATFIVGLATFQRNARLKRAEWLSQLHAKFYETGAYKRIRHILDYKPDPEFTNLRVAVTEEGHEHDELAEALVDYLNFFEFVASLWKIGQLSLREISMVFAYYLRNLKQHQFVMDFVTKNDFENLDALLPRISDKPA